MMPRSLTVLLISFLVHAATAANAFLSAPIMATSKAPPRGGSFQAKAMPTEHSVDGTPFYLVSSSADAVSTAKVNKPLSALASLWSTVGVLYILGKAITRVVPIALEPLRTGSTLVLTQAQWGAYAATCLFFAYYEGYKGFQTKFSPLVVKRSFGLVIGGKQNVAVAPASNPLNLLLAPLYSMGLISATRKRTIVSWCVTLGVAGIVGAVKRLPPVWRTIVDAGVVVGLTWGAASIAVLYLKSWISKQPPNVDSCLRVKTE